MNPRGRSAIGSAVIGSGTGRYDESVLICSGAAYVRTRIWETLASVTPVPLDGARSEGWLTLG
jgi:hypothetical protein